MRKTILAAIFAASIFYNTIAQVAPFAVSDSVWTQLDALGYDSTIQITNSFYGEDETTVYTAIFQIPGELIRSLSHTGEPPATVLVGSTYTRAWTKEEVEHWIESETGSNFEGIVYTTVASSQRATITLSGDNFQALGPDKVTAVTRAWLLFLTDEDFLTYLE